MAHEPPSLFSRRYRLGAEPYSRERRVEGGQGVLDDTRDDNDSWSHTGQGEGSLSLSVLPASAVGKSGILQL